MNNLKIFGKFLDQPILISKLNKKMPIIMTCGAGLFWGKEIIDVFQKNNPEKETEIIKKGVILASCVASALYAPKIASKITKRAQIESLENITLKNKQLINDFLNKKQIDTKTYEILNKAKEKVLSLSELKHLSEKLNNRSGKEFFNKLIPNPENIKASDIFSEIGFLSVYGAVPVVGGILGGIVADILVKEDCKKSIPNKINEGIYQYLANIFMCNIGAGLALGLLEKANITSKTARAIGMTTGIVLTGILGGSKIANMISKKIVNPIISPNETVQTRTPELIDIGLHIDDIATVSLLSGLKWIEPALPILYSISGYKAGIGYRN